MKRILLCVLSCVMNSVTFSQQVISDSSLSKINTYGFESCDSLTSFTMRTFKIKVSGSKTAVCEIVSGVNVIALDAGEFDYRVNDGKLEFALNGGAGHCLSLQATTQILFTNADMHDDQVFIYAKVTKGKFFKYCCFIFTNKKDNLIIDFDDQVYEN